MAQNGIVVCSVYTDCGFAAAGISHNTVVGYMVAMIVYLANYGLKGKLGRFSLFAMSVLILLTFVILKAEQKH